jgi:pyridoxal phosphate enzyme (YggS family)
LINAIDIARRLDGVRTRIADAASRSGRSPSSVRLVAVSKTFPVEAIRAAAAAGQIDFGENKVQEGESKILAAASLPLRWHLIGHLQSNKAKKAAGSFDVVHSIDSADLVKRIDEAAAALKRRVELLIQIDLAHEATKHGASESEAPSIIEAALACSAAQLTGLMLLPPAVDNPDDARPYFSAVKALRDRYVNQGVPADALRELSMGMSHDFEVAIEEGATLVRVGSAIFGERS